jgi:hypothetical protein
MRFVELTRKLTQTNVNCRKQLACKFSKQYFLCFRLTNFLLQQTWSSNSTYRIVYGSQERSRMPGMHQRRLPTRAHLRVRRQRLSEPMRDEATNLRPSRRARVIAELSEDAIL